MIIKVFSPILLIIIFIQGILKKMKKIYKQEEINVDVQTIFNLINNVEDYPNFLPWCTKTEVTKESENTNIGKIFISKSFIKWNFSTKI